MKHITLLTLLLLTLQVVVFAQDKKLKKKEIEFTVAGKCDMCKTRIEKGLDIPGVKFAEWTIETQKCKVVFNPQKITEEEIHKIIAKIGHDTEKVKATDEDYNNLHACCHYERLKE